MEEEIVQKNYETISEDKTTVTKQYPKLNTLFMTNFAKGKDIFNDNSELKYNQAGVIEKYGLFYFYNESGIYFIDNKKLNILIKKENKDFSYTDLFYLKCDDIFNILQIEHEENIYLIIITKNPDKYSFIIYISVTKLIEAINKQKNIYDINIIKNLEEKENLFEKGYFTRALGELEPDIELNEEGIYEEVHLIKRLSPEEKMKNFIKEKNRELEERNDIFENKYKNSEKYNVDKVIYLDENSEEIIVLDYDNYVVRYNNGDIVFYKNYERTRIIEKKALKMCYNKDTNIFLILNEESIFIYQEKNNFEIFEEKKQILLKNILTTSIKEEKIIHIENIYNYVILYSIENKENPESADKLYFLQMNSNFNEVIKVYLEKEYFFPDEYELDGIANVSQLKRSVFTIYDRDINVYFVFNKHMDQLRKYYGFRKISEDNYEIVFYHLEDDQILNSCIGDLDKFNNEDIKKIAINPFIGISIIKFKFSGYEDETKFNGPIPYLLICLGYYGGFKIVTIKNEDQKYKLKEQTNFFKKTDNICNKALKIKINDEIAETEKESFLYYSHKKESLIEILNRKTINLRNIFLHDLDFQIKDNLSKIKKSAFSDKIKMDLIKLNEITKKKVFEEIRGGVDDLIENAEELFNKEEENQMFIKKNKEITEKNKNYEKNIKNEIKRIEEDKNKFKELNLNINSINLILTNPKIKNFFGENEIKMMIDFYNEIKNNINIFENHTNLIEKMNQINLELISKLENCKKNYIKKKEYDCLKKRKDLDDVKQKIQNNIFIMYMRSLNIYFWDLCQFKENEMTEELNNLNELKRKYYLKNFPYINEEEKNNENDNNYINNKKRKKFLLNEEDIDEGDENSNKNIIINNKSSMSKSYKNKEQRLVLANNDIINNKEIDKNILIERKKDEIINKLFNMNLVKEKNYEEKNKLSEILSNFEGRVTLYDESTEDEKDCIKAEELVSDFLKSDEEKNLEEKKVKALKEKKDKEKEKNIKYIKNSLEQNKKQRDKIEEELKKIEDEKKTEIIEKERQINELKNILEELNNKFQENKKEREKEKKIYKEEIEKKENEEQKKLNDEKNKSDELIKKMEKDLQDYKNKLSQEEKKRKELEEKNKKLEAEKINNNINNQNININNNIQNINNNLNNEQSQNKFVRNISSVREEEKKENNNDKSKDIFGDLNIKPEKSINNIPLFTSNKNNGNNLEEQNKNNDDLTNLFKTSNNIKSTNNIFSTGQANQKNIFAFGNLNTQDQNKNEKRNDNNTNQNIFNINNNDNINQNNNVFNINNKDNNNNNQNVMQQNNQNKNNIFPSFPKNIFGNDNNNKPNNIFGQIGYGQHRNIGENNNNNNVNKNNNPISYSFGNIQNNQNNNNKASPFTGLGAAGGLFQNNNANSNQNQDSYF